MLYEPWNRPSGPPVANPNFQSVTKSEYTKIIQIIYMNTASRTEKDVNPYLHETWILNWKSQIGAIQIKKYCTIAENGNKVR